MEPPELRPDLPPPQEEPPEERPPPPQEEPPEERPPPNPPEEGGPDDIRLRACSLRWRSRIMASWAWRSASSFCRTSRFASSANDEICAAYERPIASKSSRLYGRAASCASSCPYSGSRLTSKRLRPANPRLSSSRCAESACPWPSWKIRFTASSRSFSSSRLCETLLNWREVSSCRVSRRSSPLRALSYSPRSSLVQVSICGTSAAPCRRREPVVSSTSARLLRCCSENPASSCL